MLRITSHFPTSITIDGAAVSLRVTRFDPDQALAFYRDHERLARELERLAVPAADETPEQRDGREQRELEIARAAIAFNVASIAAYITVEPGGLEHDETPVTDGATLARLFGGRDEVMRELLWIIYLENRLGATAKAEWHARRVQPTPVLQEAAAA